MLEGAKSMGAGAATIASAGAAVGIGNVFSSLIHSVARNFSLAKQLFGYAILGFFVILLIFLEIEILLKVLPHFFFSISGKALSLAFGQLGIPKPIGMFLRIILLAGVAQSMVLPDGAAGEDAAAAAAAAPDLGARRLDVNHQIDDFLSGFNQRAVRSDFLIKVREELGVDKASLEELSRIESAMKNIKALDGEQRPSSARFAAKALFSLLQGNDG